MAERQGEPELSPSEVTGPHAWEEQEDPEELAKKAAANRLRMKKATFWIVVAFAVVAIGAAAAFFLFLNQAGSALDRNIELQIVGPQKIAAGEKVTFEVKFRNLNKTAIESAELIFDYPAGARPLFGDPPKGKFRERVAIGRMSSGEERSERFEGYLFGEEESTLETRATLEYRPTNSSARFGKETAHAVVIDRSPIGISIAMPDDASIGQEIEITVDYVSTADTLFRDVALDVTYPSGFEYDSADPAPAKDNNLWRIGDISPGEHGSIHIKGVVTGDARETKHVYTRIGLFSESTATWSLYSQARDQLMLREALLAVDIKAGRRSDAEYVVQAGETASFEIKWKNNLPVIVRNALIEVEMEGQTIDWRSVRPNAGTFDGASRKVVWNAFTNPALRFLDPGTEGSVSMSVRMVDPLPIKGFADKNFTVKVSALMYSNTIPENFSGTDIRGRDTFSFKLGTRLSATARAYYFSNVIANSGPLPPRVGQETTYTVTWSLANTANDIEGVTVRAGLLPYAKWKQVVSPSNERVTFDPDTGDLIWEPGVVAAGTGITRPAREVSFQIGVVPGPNLINRPAELVSEARVSGRDAFTGLKLEAKASELNTAVRHDSKVNQNQYGVKE